MLLEYVPLLQVQRDLYAMPRGGERFRAYLRTMIDPHTRDLRLPLVNMNPMGKEHVPRLIDELLDLDAEGIARQAVERAAAVQRAVAGSFRVALVVVERAAAVQRAVAGSFRVALVVVGHGDAASLGEMLAQEGYAMARAGCRTLCHAAAVGGGWTNRYTNDYANRFATRIRGRRCSPSCSGAIGPR